MTKECREESRLDLNRTFIAGTVRPFTITSKIISRNTLCYFFRELYSFYRVIRIIGTNYSSLQSETDGVDAKNNFLVDNKYIYYFRYKVFETKIYNKLNFF